MAAITFTRNAVGNLSGVKAVAGLNDNWIQFNGQSDALSAEIVITNNDTAEEKTFVISPDGSATPQFYFNLKEAVRSFFPIAIDDFDYSGDVTDPVKVWQDLTIDITITHESSGDDTGSISAYFLRSKRQPPESIFITTFERLTKKAVLFDGYPLSVSSLGSSLGSSSVFDFAAVSTSISYVRYKADGTKMYLMNGSNIYEYDITSGNPSTASLNDTFDVATEAGISNLKGFYITPSGQHLLAFNGTSITLLEFGTSFDVTTLSILTTFAPPSLPTGAKDIYYNAAGTKLFVLGDAQVKSYVTTSITDNTPTLDETENISEDTDCKAIKLSTDGLTLYIAGNGNKQVFQYALASANTLTGKALTTGHFVTAVGDLFGLETYSGDFIVIDQNPTYEVQRITSSSIITRYTVDSGNKALLIDEERDECGVYLKWLNWQGGYSYWLFERIYPETHQTRSEGEYLNNAIDEPNFPTFEIGKEIRISRQLKGTANDRATIELFQSLVRSNEVYLFTGEKGDAADETTWMTVTIRDGSFKFTNKRDTMEMSFTIDLPTV